MKHRGAVAAKPFCVWNAAVAGRQETLVVTPRKFPLCSTNLHPAVQTVGVAVRFGVLAQYRNMSWRVSWRSISRSQDGLDRQVQCVWYITTTTPLRPRTAIAVVPNAGSVGKHRSAVAAKPFCARNTAVSVRQESLAVFPRKFPLCSTNSHPAVQATGLAVLVRSSRPVSQYFVVKKMEVHSPLPGRSR